MNSIPCLYHIWFHCRMFYVFSMDPIRKTQSYGRSQKIKSNSFYKGPKPYSKTHSRSLGCNVILDCQWTHLLLLISNLVLPAFHQYVRYKFQVACSIDTRSAWLWLSQHLIYILCELSISEYGTMLYHNACWCSGLLSALVYNRFNRFVSWP